MRNMQHKIESYKNSRSSQCFTVPHPIDNRAWQISGEISETF